MKVDGAGSGAQALQSNPNNPLDRGLTLARKAMDKAKKEGESLVGLIEAAAPAPAGKRGSIVNVVA